MLTRGWVSIPPLPHKLVLFGTASIWTMRDPHTILNPPIRSRRVHAPPLNLSHTRHGLRTRRLPTAGPVSLFPSRMPKTQKKSQTPHVNSSTSGVPQRPPSLLSGRNNTSELATAAQTCHHEPRHTAASTNRRNQDRSPRDPAKTSRKDAWEMGQGGVVSHREGQQLFIWHRLEGFPDMMCDLALLVV